MADNENNTTETTSLLNTRSSSNEPRRGLVASRFISEWLSSRIPNYGAHGDLQAAFDYLEQYVLPRKVLDEYKKATPGTPNTELYSAFCTPQAALRDFGTGVAVYFETLRYLGVICFVAFLLYLPSIYYYQSTQYDPGNDADTMDVYLLSSLMCVATVWVPCLDCPLHDIDVSHRVAVSPTTNQTFILKNACAPMRWNEGINHLVVCVFLTVSLIYLGVWQSRLEQSYDEQVLTAQDYSVVVLNPPPHANNPTVWKKFFSQFGTVRYVTIALDNEELVALLVKRRAVLLQASFHIQDLDDATPLQSIPDDIRKQHPKLQRKLDTVEGEICDMIRTSAYNTTRVFCIFETEAAQRKALRALTVSGLTLATNDTSQVPSQYLFENQILQVQEALEPSVVRWQDLNETLQVRIWQRVLSGSLTVLLIVLGFWAVESAFSVSVGFAALVIALLNIGVPNIMKFVNKLESHAGESSYQASLFAKISVFRFVNTAIVTTVIKPFTATISEDAAALIPAVYAVLKAEIVTAPILHMLDIVSQIKRHVLAPRAQNMTHMVSYFRGSKQNLGEKYTNMTKVIFLCFFYSVLFPSGFLFGSFAIAATYFTDKFLLLRSWGRLPELGDDVAKLSRKVFFPVCLVTLWVVSQFYWSAFPFDDVCDADQVVPSGSRWVGEHSLTVVGDDSGSTISVSVQQSDTLYQFCDQDYLEHVRGLLKVFEMETDDWMSPNQEMLVYLFGILVAFLLVILLGVCCWYDVIPNLRGVTEASFMTTEWDSGELYSNQETIQAYIPQVPHRLFPFNLLACDISNLDTRHVGWKDPTRSYEYYELYRDVEFVWKRESSAPLDRPVLSVVRHWKS